jgi:hypothetical protein
MQRRPKAESKGRQGHERREELRLRLDETARVGYGFALEGSILPMIPKSQEMVEEVAA